MERLLTFIRENFYFKTNDITNAVHYLFLKDMSYVYAFAS